MVVQLNHEIEVRQKSERELAETNATKDKFFSIIAHDLRNPFATLKGFVDLLKRNYHKYSADELAQIINYLDSSSKTTQTFLDDLLEWSRSQMNKITLKPETLNLHNIVDLVKDLLKNQAKNKKIAIENRIEPQTYLKTDRHLLNTIIRNLITNAIKFSYPESQVMIESKELENGTEISITDFGVGISAENLPKLFSIENKYTTKGTAKEGGSGLGLLICKEFVEKLGGTICVESQVGKGSRFVVLIKN